MELLLLPQDFCVCRYRAGEKLALPEGVFFLAGTEDEVSLVCEEGRAPAGAEDVKTGYRALRVAGTLDFSLVGILARLAAALAKAGVPVLALSTYDTDYLLVEEGRLTEAVAALEEDGEVKVKVKEAGRQGVRLQYILDSAGKRKREKEASKE